MSQRLGLRNAARISAALMAISLILTLIGYLPRQGGAAFGTPLAGLLLILTLVLSAVAATYPIFLFALAKDRSRLAISRELRLLAWGVAGVQFVDAVWHLYTSLNLSYLALILVAPDLQGLQVVFGNLSNFSIVPLFVAIARYESDEGAAEFATTSLWKTARVVVVCWGLIVAGHLFRLGILPYAYYYQSREQIAQVRVPLTIYMLWGQPVEQLVQQVCLFAVPFIIAKSIQKRAPEEAPVVVVDGIAD